MQHVIDREAHDQRAVYDHETEAGAARPGRRIADWGGDDLFHQGPRRRFRGHSQPQPQPRSLAARRAATSEPDIRGGRRTVTITGRPGALASPPRRPARTVEERIGSRPDRVASWAFGMGITLILIAVSTADAAPL